MTPFYAPVVGGVERHAAQLAHDLRALGRRLLVLTTRLPGHRHEVVRLGGIPVIRVGPAAGRQHATKWRFIPAIVWWGWRLRGRYDVIFCPDLRAVGLAAVGLGWLTRRAVVLQGATPGAFSAGHWRDALDSRAGSAAGPLLRILRGFVDRIHRRAWAAVAITREAEREALALGFEPDRVAYLPHGVDLDRFRPLDPPARASLRASLGCAPDLPIVLFLGRLSREKGVLDLVEAWRLVDQSGRRRSARLVLVGPDMTGHDLDAGPEARHRVTVAGLDASVQFVGASSTPERWLQAADVVVHPSHWEAFPVAAVEALASGCALIATPVGGLVDYLQNGVNALVTPPESPAALADGLVKLLGDDGLRRQLGLAGRAVVTSRFDARRQAAEYAALFDRASGR